MRMAAFASRNVKEIVRDRVNLMFGLLFPVVLIALLGMIANNVPGSPFSIATLAPGIAVFGLSFLSLFSGMLIAKDRSSSLMMRLLASPLTATDFILGYTLPLLPMAIAQGAVCYLAAFCLGLPVTVHVLAALVMLIPAAFLYIGLGLLCGTVFNDRQVGGVCGALLTNLSAWLSGTWFDLSLVGGWFERIGYALPFVHAVDMGRAALSGDYAGILPHLWWVLGYALAVLAIAIALFYRKMKAN